MLAVETGTPRLFPLNGILTAATPCETIKNPDSSFGGSLQTEPLPMNPESQKKMFKEFSFYLFIIPEEGSNVEWS